VIPNNSPLTPFECPLSPSRRCQGDPWDALAAGLECGRCILDSSAGPRWMRSTCRRLVSVEFDYSVHLLESLSAGLGCRGSAGALLVSSSLPQPLLCGQLDLAVQFR